MPRRFDDSARYSMLGRIYKGRSQKPRNGARPQPLPTPPKCDIGKGMIHMTYKAARQKRRREKLKALPTKCQCGNWVLL